MFFKICIFFIIQPCEHKILLFKKYLLNFEHCVCFEVSLLAIWFILPGRCVDRRSALSLGCRPSTCMNVGTKQFVTEPTIFIYNASQVTRNQLEQVKLEREKNIQNFFFNIICF